MTCTVKRPWIFYMEPPQDIFLYRFVLSRDHIDGLRLYVLCHYSMSPCQAIWYVFMGPGLKLIVLCFF